MSVRTLGALIVGSFSFLSSSLQATPTRMPRWWPRHTHLRAIGRLLTRPPVQQHDSRAQLPKGVTLRGVIAMKRTFAIAICAALVFGSAQRKLSPTVLRDLSPTVL